jgi:hypothetical protein
MADNALHASFHIGAEPCEEARLVVTERVDVERIRNLLLPAEVVIDRADARTGAGADLIDRCAFVAALAEAGKRRIEDLGSA